MPLLQALTSLSILQIPAGPGAERPSNSKRQSQQQPKLDTLRGRKIRKQGLGSTEPQQFLCSELPHMRAPGYAQV